MKENATFNLLNEDENTNDVKILVDNVREYAGIWANAEKRMRICRRETCKMQNR